MSRRIKVVSVMAMGAIAIAFIGVPSVSLAEHNRSWPIERRGKQTQNVWTVQYLLRSRGYSLAVDGIFGRQTENRVRRFQRAHDLRVDGIVGPATWRHLIRRVARGSRGDAVRAAQSNLCAHGYYQGLDGIFGARTERAVRRFQSHEGLVRDGIVGTRTWQELVRRIHHSEYPAGAGC